MSARLYGQFSLDKTKRARLSCNVMIRKAGPELCDPTLWVLLAEGPGLTYVSIPVYAAGPEFCLTFILMSMLIQQVSQI